jgi:hypothetical protein
LRELDVEQMWNVPFLAEDSVSVAQTKRRSKKDFQSDRGIENDHGRR